MGDVVQELKELEKEKERKLFYSFRYPWTQDAYEHLEEVRKLNEQFPGWYRPRKREPVQLEINFPIENTKKYDDGAMYYVVDTKRLYSSAL